MHAIIPLIVLPFQVSFWKFDKDGAVLKYDTWIPNLNAWIEASTGIPISNPQLEAGTLQQLCAVTQQRCTGSNTQWTSVDQCVSTLSQKPFGNYDEAWGDNIVCRTIHLVLTQVRPQVSSLLHKKRVSHEQRRMLNYSKTGPLPPRGTHRGRQMCGLCLSSWILQWRSPLRWSARWDIHVPLTTAVGARTNPLWFDHALWIWYRRTLKKVTLSNIARAL